MPIFGLEILNNQPLIVARPHYTTGISLRFTPAGDFIVGAANPDLSLYRIIKFKVIL